MASPGASRRSMVPVCRACKEPERPYQPLIRCVGCRRRYHAACYNPPPLDPSNWTCKKCMQPERNRRYNETWSSTTLATQNSSPSSSRPPPESDMSRTGFLFTPHSSDAAGTMGSGKTAEKQPELAVQSSKAKLHPDSNSGSKGLGIRMTKSAPGPAFAKSSRSIPKQSPSLTGGPKFVASPNSIKPAARRRSILSPGESPVVTGSPATKKPRPTFGSYDINNTSAQPPAYGSSPNSRNRTDKLFDISLSQNGTTQRRSSKDNRNGLENASFVETVHQPSTNFDTDRRPPVPNHVNGNNANFPSIRHSENGVPYSNGLKDRWDEAARDSPLYIFGAASLEQNNLSSKPTNGFSNDAGRGTYIFDDLRAPRTKSSVKSKPAKRDSRTAQRVSDALGLRAQPQLSGKSPETITRKPPMELQRERLAKEQSSESTLDALIYGQDSAAEPPPGVIVPETRPRLAKEPRFYAHIDPRVHWCRPHSKEWHEKKQAEIKERGGRKANFGKAAERMKKQRAENPIPDEELLPERVRENPEWLRAQAWFKECSQKDWEKDKEATRRAEAEAKSKTKTGERRR